MSDRSQILEATAAAIPAITHWLPLPIRVFVPFRRVSATDRLRNEDRSRSGHITIRLSQSQVWNADEVELHNKQDPIPQGHEAVNRKNNQVLCLVRV